MDRKQIQIILGSNPESFLKKQNSCPLHWPFLHRQLLPVSHSSGWFIPNKQSAFLISPNRLSKYYAKSFQTLCKMPHIHPLNSCNFHLFYLDLWQFMDNFGKRGWTEIPSYREIKTVFFLIHLQKQRQSLIGESREFIGSKTSVPEHYKMQFYGKNWGSAMQWVLDMFLPVSEGKPRNYAQEGLDYLCFLQVQGSKIYSSSEEIPLSTFTRNSKGKVSDAFRTLPKIGLFSVHPLSTALIFSWLISDSSSCTISCSHRH